jgi:peptidoglycan/xylan/chitin deacetylase (PgdA/CDA1 family)
MHLGRLAPLAALISATAIASTAAADAPQLGFDDAPSYLGPREVVLTFNDAPGWNASTIEVLDVLRDRSVRAAFFVNSGPETTAWSPMARAAVTRIVEEGHEIGTHGRNHRHLTELDDAALRREIFGVEDDLAQLGLATRLSLFRAAYGEPYLAHFQRTVLGWDVDDRGYDRIAAVAAERAVHIGWNLDSEDWRCPRGPTGATCAFETIRAKLEAGQHGIILMHANDGRTAPALAMLLDYLDAEGYSVVSLEQAVCNALGATSANVIDDPARPDGCHAPEPPDADVSPRASRPRPAPRLRHPAR